MKNFLKRLLGKRGGNMERADGTPQAGGTVVGSPRATSLPRVQEVVSSDWQSGRQSHGRRRLASPGSVPAAGRAVADGNGVRYRTGDRIGGRGTTRVVSPSEHRNQQLGVLQRRKSAFLLHQGELS